MSGWVDIQRNAFTRWCNDHLKDRGFHCEDLTKDMRSGIMLINLLEILSGKSVGRYNKNPRVPFQKFENCQIALDFLKAEGIRLVNIGSEDISNGNEKLMLGLIWTLILRYQINKRAGDDANSARNDLLRWVQSKIPQYNIKGFTKDWNDGRAICGLVNALRPHLLKEHDRMTPADALGNATKGINTAEEKMGVCALIHPDEMTHPKVDEKAMMCYISQFRDLEDEPAPVSDASRCCAYGPGLVQGVVGEPAPFKVENPSRVGQLKVWVDGPHSAAKVDLTDNKDGTYDVQYHPTEPGDYYIHVTLDGVDIPGSVFHVQVLAGISLGGEGRIRVFFSTTRSSEKGRQDNYNLSSLLESKGIHLREDFEPWIPIDILDREDREAVFKKAGVRSLPIVFIDDEYTGDFETMVDLDKSGKLDQIIRACKQHYVPSRYANLQKKYENPFSDSKSPAIGAGYSPKQQAPQGLGAPVPVPSAKPGGGRRPQKCPKCGKACGFAKSCNACGTVLS